MSGPDFSCETTARHAGRTCIAGVDEVGRGPLAGPVIAAAVVLDPQSIPDGLNDSKILKLRHRTDLAKQIACVASVGIGAASVSEIDELNILRASHLAMVRALNALECPPDFALIDGNSLPERLPCAGQAVVKGDARCLSIAAASIVAKVHRDRIMVDLAQHYPGYGWDQNVGYPTKSHRAALVRLGVTPHHRRSFKPVHNILCQEKSASH
ncbi:MAG: ribonuclease HII [Pseudomonadota bacterium]